jgi:hypothetical protein
MSNLVPLTTRVLAPGAILAAGMIFMMGAPNDVLVTGLRIIAGVVVLPAAMVVTASLAQSWWRRRHGEPVEDAEAAPESRSA